MSNTNEDTYEITNLPCPVCGTHLQIYNGKTYVCPHCGHVEPINEDDPLVFPPKK